MKTTPSIAAAVTAAAFFCTPAQLANAQTTEWAQIPTDPANTPPGRDGAGMVYDEQRERIIMHGGFNQVQDFNDTWEWDGMTWTLVSTSGPAVRFHGMAYDANRGVIVLYGGRNNIVGNQNTNETWEYDGVTWTRIDSETNDPNLVLMTLVYDRERGKVIRHGGVNSGDWSYMNGATFEWDGANWVAFATGTHAHGAGAGIYDSYRKRTVTFAGRSLDSTDPPLNHPSPDNETWEFDGTTWNLLSIDSPAPRYFHALAYDAYRRVSVLYGGYAWTSPVEFSDTVEFNGLAWNLVNVQGSPGRRMNHAMAFDLQRRCVVLFGGSPDFQNNATRARNDTWEYGIIPLRLTLIPGPDDGMSEIQWTGELPPYQLQSRFSLSEGDWQNEGEPTDASNATIPMDGHVRFFRVLSLFGGKQQP